MPPDHPPTAQSLVLGLLSPDILGHLCQPGNVQLSQLVLIHCRGCVQHEVLGSLGFGEGDDVRILDIIKVYSVPLPTDNSARGEVPLPSYEEVTQRAGSLRALTGLTEAEFQA
jgi:hypothetical protein